MSTLPTRITVKVNLDHVLKEHLYKGKKGTYLDLVLWNTPDSPFGHDFSVKQDLGKEAREQGIKTEFLGNAKAHNIGQGKPAQQEGQAAPSQPAQAAPINPADDLPF